MTNEELRNKIEALKLQKELAELQSQQAERIQEVIDEPEACQPVAPHVVKAQPRNTVDEGICERTDYAPGFKGNRDEINLARTRCYGVAVAHLIPFVAPISSAVFAAKTSRWGAFAAATGVALVGGAIVGPQASFGILAPATSAVLTIKAITDQRKRLGITTVSQADAMKFSSF